MTRIALMLALLAQVFAQTPDIPRFEVAAIKPSPVDDGWSGIQSGNGRIFARNVTLKRCITGAYEVAGNRVFGGPPWLDTERFEITAKAAQGLGDHELMLALQTLLADRFKLAIRRETRPMQVYVLEPTKNVRLEKDDGGQSTTDNGRGNLIVRNTTMDRFAEVLGRQTDSPVVNQTGLDGVFKLQLKWSLDSAKDGGPSLYTAIQEQLGLRLHAQKMPLEVLVIDHAERPSEN
jgi:uncharacterized protein (TIGR03435 family)